MRQQESYALGAMWKTEDFIKWTYLPAALAPDEEYDGDGIFSGSVVENMGKQVLRTRE